MCEDVTVDGAKSLDEQNQTLNFYQQQKGCKVVKYVKNTTPPPQNIATSQKLPMGTTVPILYLVKIPAGSEITALKPANTTLTFDGIVFVDSTETHVAGFHASNT
ncbi:MAG: hypothetical protein ACLPX5_07785 [Dissulfurispiraceae bacterium]